MPDRVSVSEISLCRDPSVSAATLKDGLFNKAEEVHSYSSNFKIFAEQRVKHLYYNVQRLYNYFHNG